MFENSGAKLRTFGKILFILTIVTGALMLLGSILSANIFVGILGAIVYGLSGWIGAVSMVALADAAECSEAALANTNKILAELRMMRNEVPKLVPSAPCEPKNAPVEAGFAANRVPVQEPCQQKSES